MTPKLLHTDDGSFTLRLDEMDETYHSTHGALTEAKYVYIENGFKRADKEAIKILEIGFGTGLNALATIDAFLQQDTVKTIHYHTLEKFPVKAELITELKYGALLDPDRTDIFDKIHQAAWNTTVEIIPGFTIFKQELDLLTDDLNGAFDLVYYDAFAPSKQIEMWHSDTIQKVVNTMNEDALLSTYCVQGDAKRAFIAAGLKLKRLPGPPGKRHMLIGIKK